MSFGERGAWDWISLCWELEIGPIVTLLHRERWQSGWPATLPFSTWPQSPGGGLCSFCTVGWGREKDAQAGKVRKWKQGKLAEGQLQRGGKWCVAGLECGMSGLLGHSSGFPTPVRTKDQHVVPSVPLGPGQRLFREWEEARKAHSFSRGGLRLWVTSSDK